MHDLCEGSALRDLKGDVRQVFYHLKYFYFQVPLEDGIFFGFRQLTGKIMFAVLKTF